MHCIPLGCCVGHFILSPSSIKVKILFESIMVVYVSWIFGSVSWSLIVPAVLFFQLGHGGFSYLIMTTTSMAQLLL